MATVWLAAPRRALRWGIVVAALVVTAVSLIPPAAADPDVADAQRRLDALRAQLVTLTQQLDSAAAAFEGAQAHHLRLTDELVDAEEVIENARSDVESVQDAFEARIAGAYKRPGSEMALAGAVLLAPDPPTAMHRAALLDRVSVRGAARVNQAMEMEAITADAVRQHQVVYAGASTAAADLQRVADDLTLAVQTAQHQVSSATKALATAEAAASRRAAASAAPGPVHVDGKVCPIGSPNGFIDSWGFPRSGGRRHQGVDMFAAYGTPLYAVADGVVQQVGTNQLGGLYVNLIDLQGHRYYYAHLSAVQVVTGQRVRAGEIVGGTGDSGNARGTPPHLHWQYHPGNGPPVNPFPLARALCRPT